LLYIFEDYALDPDRRELCRRGSPIPLEPQVFDVLDYLIQNRQRVVTRDDLIASVWGGRIVSESALSTRINGARSAIGDRGAEQRFIKTIPRRGFRFVGDVREQRPAESPPDVDPYRAPLPLPDRPSIAVLPFTNLSGDPDQEYFANGTVEDIITGLSRIKWLFVIASNSSLTYKRRPVDVKQVGRELGVRYLLEGSVRKAGHRVRITGQLIDATTGAHLWADRFDGSLDDIFDLQDRVTADVVSAIAPKMEQAEIERAKCKPTESLDAYDYRLRGMASVYLWTKEGVSDALRLFYKAIEHDCEYGSAYGAAAWCYYWRMVNGWMNDRASEVAEVVRLSENAGRFGKDDAVALSLGGLALGRVAGEVETGVTMIDRALVLNPNLASAWNASGFLRTFLGDYDLAITHLTQARRRNPLDHLSFHTQAVIALAHFLADRNDVAWPIAERACREQPKLVSALRLAAATNACAGRLEEARAFVAQALEIDPRQRLSNLRDRVGPFRPTDLAKYVKGLRLAGLPE
jgi:TolB-like protein